MGFSYVYIGFSFNHKINDWFYNDILIQVHKNAFESLEEYNIQLGNINIWYVLEAQRKVLFDYTIPVLVWLLEFLRVILGIKTPGYEIQ